MTSINQQLLKSLLTVSLAWMNIASSVDAAERAIPPKTSWSSFRHDVRLSGIASSAMVLPQLANPTGSGSRVRSSAPITPRVMTSASTAPSTANAPQTMNAMVKLPVLLTR